jgi:hypothetical protein
MKCSQARVCTSLTAHSLFRRTCQRDEELLVVTSVCTLVILNLTEALDLALSLFSLPLIVSGLGFSQLLLLGVDKPGCMTFVTTHGESPVKG